MDVMSGFVPSEPFTVEAKQNGHLKCQGCNTFWCGHIQQFINDRADAESIWQVIEQGFNEPPIVNVDIEVPVVPEKNIFCRTILSPVNKTIAEINILDNVFLGYLNKGEGRGTLKSILDNWLFVQEFAACSNSQHSFTQQMIWEKDMTTPAGRRAEFWSLSILGKCLGCSMSGSDSFDDLVPNFDKPKTPWS